MKRKLTYFLRPFLWAAIAFAAPVKAQDIKDDLFEPVVLNADPDHGACSIGLQVTVEGARLHAGPGRGSPVLARLPKGTIVAGCAARMGWEGVIEGQDETCGIGVILQSPKPYEGPCRSGWIETGVLVQIYG